MDLLTIFLLALCLLNNLYVTGYASYAFSVFVLCSVCLDLVVKKHPSLIRKVANLLQRNQTEAQDRILSGILEDINSIDELSKKKKDSSTSMYNLSKEKKASTSTDYKADKFIKTIQPQPRSEDFLPAASKSGSYSQGADKNVVVRMDQDLEVIRERLCGGSSELKIISLVGMGGIGKTTLAKKIYNDNAICSYFDIRAWTTVSSEYSFHHILLDLLNCANPNVKIWNGERSNEDLCAYLRKSLYGRRYLIIIDAVWDIDTWDEVRTCFPDNRVGSCVLLTTRLTEVAHRAGCHIHHMHLLNVRESQNLLYSRVFGREDCPVELRQIGDDIVRRCAGLPLALVVIAGVLSTIEKTEKNWRPFADGVISASIVDDEIMEILALSYSHLPHHLRPCFLYMGMFPADYEVSVTKLAHLWAAEGFLHRLDDIERPEKIAAEYLEDLVQRNLILVNRRSVQGKIKRCKIHNILWELCFRVARKEKFYCVINRQQSVLCSDIGSYPRLAIHTELILKVLPKVHRKSRTHSLLCMGDGSNNLGRKTHFNFSHYKLLRVLDLLATHLSMFPLEISNLISLRYLALAFTGMLHPHISRLWNLQTIVHRDPSSSHVDSMLPVEIWTMTNLRHLFVPATCLSSPPIGSKGSFDLQTLVEVINLSFGIQIVDKIKSVKKLAVSYDVELESFKGWSGHRLRNLSQLNQLEKLKLRVVNSGIPPKVSYPWNLAFPLSLRNLTLNGSRIPWERLAVAGALPNLEVLKLRYDACEGEKWEPMEGEYCNLKYLELQHLELVHWTADCLHFPRLQCLAVKSCHQLDEIPSSIGDIETLQRIEVVDCHSSVVTSAEYIRLEQYEVGNWDLEINIYHSGEIEEARAKIEETKETRANIEEPRAKIAELAPKR